MVSDKGYRRRTLGEIVDAKIAKAKELFGAEINTEENTALGKFIWICAYDQYRVEELAEQIYYSIFPQTAFGQSLDRLGWSVGIKRNAASPATYKVKVTGTAGATIEAGFLVGIDLDYVGQDGGLMFENTAATVIGDNGECEIIVTCTTNGTVGNVSPSMINRVANSVAYIDTVEGIEVIEVAADEESDSDFRKRYEIAREGNGSCTVASLRSALIDIPTVHSAYVEVNESATDTINGVPPKTIACYVDGGINYSKEIAEAIFEKKPIGVGTHGTQSVKVSHGALTDYEVKYSYTEYVDCYIKLTISTNEKFGTNGNVDIKENIEAFINNLEMGEQLVTTALYGDIYKVAGVVSAIVETSKDGKTYSQDNIAVKAFERCAFNTIIINGETV